MACGRCYALDAGGEFGECDPDTVLGEDFGGELRVAAPQVLHERVAAAIVRSEQICFSPRIGRSLALSRP